MNKLLIASSAFVVATAVVPAAKAETYTWTGAQDAYWTNAANWKVGEEVASCPPGRYLVYSDSGNHFATNGVLGDTAIFGAVATENKVINLDGENAIASVQVTGEGGEQAFTFGTVSGKNTAAEQAQYLKLEPNANVAIDASVAKDVTIQALCMMRNTNGTDSANLYFTNNSTTAEFIWKRNGRFSKVGNTTIAKPTYPSYNLYGVGVFHQDGPTDYDRVNGFYVRGTGKVIMGETTRSGGARVWSAYYPSSSIAGTRELEIPAGRYLHGVTGGHDGIQIDSYVNLHVDGEGTIVCEPQYNTSVKWSGNFLIDWDKTLTIDNVGIAPATSAFDENIGIYGWKGKVILNTTNNTCIGDVRMRQGSSLYCKRFGLKSDPLGTSPLGGAQKVLFFYTDNNYDVALGYCGTGDETLDRTIAFTNDASVATIENTSVDGKLTVESAAVQTGAKATTCTLNLKATTNPIVFDGSLEAGKDWKVMVSGAAGVGFNKLPKAGDEDVPVVIRNGGTLTVSDLWAMPKEFAFASGTANIKVLDGCDIFDDVVPTVPSGSVLNYIVPDSSTITFSGEKAARRLANVTLNGVAAAVDAEGHLFQNADGTNATWIKPNVEGDWTDADNWKDSLVAVNGDRVFVTPDHLTTSNNLTIKIDGDVSLKHLRLQDSKGGKFKITGNGTLTVAGGNGGDESYKSVNYGGITVYTNGWSHAVNNQGWSHGNGFPDIDVPLTIGSDETYLNWPSDRGWTLDPNYEPSIHAITKDFNKDGGWLNLAGSDGWFTFQQGGGTKYPYGTRIMGYVEMRGTNQFHRLGPGSLVEETWWLNAMPNCWGSVPILLYSLLPGETGDTIPNNINFDYHAGCGRHGCSGPYFGGICFQSADNTSSLAATNVLTLTGALNGDAKATSGNCAFINSNGKNHAEKQARFLSPYSSRIVIAGNSPNATKVSSMTTLGITEIASENALGTGNTLTMYGGNNGWWNTAQPFGLNGLLVRPGITYNGAVKTTPTRGPDNACGAAPFMLVGAAQPGEAEAVYNGEITETTSTDNTVSPIRFHAPKGGKARFNGKVTAVTTTENAAMVLAEGDIILANNENSFARPLQVRAGRLVMAAQGAAGTKSINLGGIVRQIPGYETVVALEDGSTPKLADTTKWDWWSVNEWSGKYDEKGQKIIIYYSGTWIHFSDDKMPETIDGVKISKNQKILINTPAKRGFNGFWNATGDGYQRPWAYKVMKDYRDLFGTKFKVTSGEKYGGKTFFFAVDLDATSFVKNSAGLHATMNIDGISFGFHEEPTDADVAVMTEGTLTVTNDIDVVNNYSAGKSILGGVTEGANSGFSGNIALAKSVTLSAPANGEVVFTGEIAGDGDIIAEGAGASDLTAANVTLSSTNCYILAQGTLKLTQEQAESQLIWRRGVGTDGDYTGTLVVNGDLDLTNAKFENFTFDDSKDVTHTLKLAEATGSITLPKKTTINKRWRLIQSDNALYAQGSIPGMMLLVK